MKVLLNVLHGIVLSIAALLLTALVVYEKRISRNPKMNCSKSIRGSVRRGGRNASEMIGRWLRILCIISFALCMCTCINDLIYYNVHMYSDSQCTAPRDLGVALLTSLDLSIYLFLWLRQYLVYKSMKMDSGLTRTLIRTFQWVTFTLIVGIFLSTTGLITCCRRYSYNATTERCFKTTPAPVELAISYIWSVGSLTMHCTLVLLFAYPLIKIALRKRTAATESNKESQKRMLALVRRCLILSIACIATDVTVMLVTSYVLRGGRYSQLRHLLYNINVLLNSTLIVASFKEWKAMIFPCVEIGQYMRKMSTVGIAYTSSSQLAKDNCVVSYQANMESQS